MVSPEIARNVDSVITTALLYVEEQVQKLLKGLIISGPRNAAEKLTLAENTARSIAPDLMAPLSSDQFAVYAEAKLHLLRQSLPAKDSITGRSLPPRSDAPASAAPFSLPPPSAKPPAIPIPKLDPLPVLAREEDPPTNPGSKTAPKKGSIR